MTVLRLVLLSCLVVIGLSKTLAFVVTVPPSFVETRHHQQRLSRCGTGTSTLTCLQATTPFLEESASTFLQAATTSVDPTALLSNTLSNLIGSPAILAVPIVAALGLATLLAWLIAAYAEPQVQDDE